MAAVIRFPHTKKRKNTANGKALLSVHTWRFLQSSSGFFSVLNGGAISVIVLLGFLLSGWSLLPLYFANASGVAVSYFLSLLFALIPIVVTGVLYIVGAYARRAKTIRQQELADKAAAAEQTKEKKINYGGLPGTKPKKRK